MSDSEQRARAKVRAGGPARLPPSQDRGGPPIAFESFAPSPMPARAHGVALLVGLSAALWLDRRPRVFSAASLTSPDTILARSRFVVVQRAVTPRFPVD
jgi:hypothetical protein